MESVAKRVKRSRPPEFRRKGNEKQYRFNEEVAEKLGTAQVELARVTATESESAPTRVELLSSLEKAVRRARRYGTSRGETKDYTIS